MEFISGNSFKQYLDAGTEFQERSVIIWMKQISATLCYLHNQKPPIIHSDIKPGNIMLMPNGKKLIRGRIFTALEPQYTI